MSARSVFSNAGRTVYAIAAMALGIINLIWADFATVWQPIQAFGDHVPHRRLFACIVAVGLLLGGLAILWRPAIRFGALLVGIMNFIFAVFWLPRVIHFPQIFGTWGGFLEALFPVAAAALLYATASSRDFRGTSKTEQLARYAFGICVLSFALDHFLALPQTAAMVPRWIPLGQRFWAVATGVAHLLAALAVLTGVADLLASRLLTLMLILFGVLVWLPRLFAHPQDHTAWAGNAVNLTMIGTAWVFANWRTARQEHVLRQPPASTPAGVTSLRS